MDNNVYQAPQSTLIESDNQGVQPVKIFNVNGRMGRFAYLQYCYGIPFIFFWIFYIGLIWIASEYNSRSDFIMEFIVILAIGVLIVWLVLATLSSIQRCHDIDVTGFLFILVFIPVINISLLILSGSKGENRFGLKPGDNKVTVYILGTIGVLGYIFSNILLVSWGIMIFKSSFF